MTIFFLLSFPFLFLFLFPSLLTAAAALPFYLFNISPNNTHSSLSQKTPPKKEERKKKQRLYEEYGSMMAMICLYLESILLGKGKGGEEANCKEEEQREVG